MKISLDPNGFMPIRAHDIDAGLDLFNSEDGDVTIPARSRAEINTGVHMEIPVGYVGLVKSKSGLMRHDGIKVEGTIDPGYTGAIHAIIFNHSNWNVTFHRGEKVAQLVIVPCITPELELVDKLDETERGDNGFGSTGR